MPNVYSLLFCNRDLNESKGSCPSKLQTRCGSLGSTIPSVSPPPPLWWLWPQHNPFLYFACLYLTPPKIRRMEQRTKLERESCYCSHSVEEVEVRGSGHPAIDHLDESILLPIVEADKERPVLNFPGKFQCAAAHPSLMACLRKQLWFLQRPRLVLRVNRGISPNHFVLALNSGGWCELIQLWRSEDLSPGWVSSGRQFPRNAMQYVLEHDLG